MKSTEITKRVVQISFDKETLAKLDKWREQQRPPAQRSATVDMLVAKFLEEQKVAARQRR